MKYYFLPLLILFTSCGFIKSKPLELLGDTRAKNVTYDAIIVPGCPHDGESWGTTMSYRVAWSVYLYENGFTNNIIYSGSSVYSKFSEAKIMALYAVELGIPSEHIFLDTNAQHSTENVYYSYLVAKENGLDKIALATDPFQNNWLNGFIDKYELPIGRLPIVFDTIGAPPSFEPKINFNQAVNHNFVSIKEREGFFKRFSGTMGKQILWHEEDLPNEALVQKYKKKGRLIVSTSQAENWMDN